MSSKTIYYTKEGYQKVKEELRQLEEKEMPLVAAEIGEASAKGDLSENAEYHAAKDRQRIISLRINELTQEMANAVILTPEQVDTNQVNILTKVQVEEVATQKSYTYQLVSEREANMKMGKLSVSSPLGRGLLGKKKGEIAKIQMPSPSARTAGLVERAFKIISITH